MKRFGVAAALLIAVLCIPISAQAGTTWYRPRPYEIQGIFALGGPLLLALGPEYGEFSSKPVAAMFALRMRTQAVAVGFEMNVVTPAGVGFHALVDIYRGKRLRVHIIDPGVFLNTVEPLSTARTKRVYDVVFGAGAEWFLGAEKNLSVTLDWRTYLPDPGGVLSRFGGYARPAYNEAGRGYVWLGIAWRH